jgi:hypothetical protein
MKFRTAQEVLRAHIRRLGVAPQTTIVQAIWLVVQVTQHFLAVAV